MNDDAQRTAEWRLDKQRRAAVAFDMGLITHTEYMRTLEDIAKPF